MTGANMGFTVALGSSGVQTLSGSNSYGGATTINSGILNIRNDSALGTTVGSTSVASGATLQLEGGITVGTETLTINGLGATGQNGALVNISGTNSYGGQLTMGSATTTAISSDNSGTLNLTNTGTITNANSRALTLTGSGNGSLAGALASGAITKNGTGTWTLTGANTYTGTTTINVGRLQLGDGNSTGSLSTSSAIVNNANLTINRSNAVAQGSDFSTAAITGTGSFIQAGTGTTTLNATNSYTGVTTVERGTLSFTSGAASATANQALGANATVILGVASISSGTLNYTGAAGTLAKNVNVLGNGSDTIQNNGTGLLTLSGNVTKNGTTLTLKGGSHGINVTGAISGSNANSDLIIDGGTTTLTNANNTYNGPTFIINGATLNASVVGALPTSTLSAVTINGTGSTLALGASQSVASLSGTSGASVNLNANTLTINGSSTTTYSGGISGTGNLVKNGSGTTTLNAANTYTGTTTVNSGTLAAAATNALGNSTVINVTGGSFLVTAANAVNDNANINLGGTLALNGTFNETVGLLTLSANSVIDLDGFTGILRFGGVGSWASNTTLAIWNWNGINGASNRHVVFTNNSGLPNYLDRISFYSGSGSGFAGTGFEEGFTGPGGGTEIIAVPETETYFYAVALLAGLVIQYIRRRAKRKVCRLRLKSDPRLNRSATTVAVTITADAHPLA
jgi:autotransporter-associated beta strand protein